MKRLQDVIAEFRWSNEKNIKFLATVSKLDEEETELPQTNEEMVNPAPDRKGLAYAASFKPK